MRPHEESAGPDRRWAHCGASQALCRGRVDLLAAHVMHQRALKRVGERVG